MVWIPLILSAANGLNQAYTGKQNADAINRAQKRYEKLNFQFANEAKLQDFAAVAAARAQSRKTLFNSLNQVTLDATRRIGSVSVASGESGLHGNTSAALLNDFRRAQLRSEGNIMDTEKYMQEQYGRDVQAIRAQAESRIRGGEQQRVQGPDYMQIAMNSLVGFIQQKQVLDAANKYQGQRVTNQNTPPLNNNPMGIPYTAPPGGGVNAPQR